MRETERGWLKLGAIELLFHVDENDGSGELVMFEFMVPPGARVPEPHYHEAVDEVIYNQKGNEVVLVKHLD